LNNNTYQNFCSGNNNNVIGIDNILFGDSLNITGNDSIIIGTHIGNNTTISKSILISNYCLNSLISQKHIENFIIIGVNNFDNIDYNDGSYNSLLNEYPIIIGNNIDNTNYYINIGNTFLKTNYSQPQIYIGNANEPVLIGYSNNILNPYKNSIYNPSLLNSNIGLYINNGLYTDGDIITKNINLQNCNIENLNNLQIKAFSSELINKGSLVRYVNSNLDYCLFQGDDGITNKWSPNIPQIKDGIYINSVINGYESNIIGVVDNYSIYGNNNDLYKTNIGNILYEYNIIIKGICYVWVSLDQKINAGDSLVSVNNNNNINLLYNLSNISSAKVDNTIDAKYIFGRSIIGWDTNNIHVLTNYNYPVANYNINTYKSKITLGTSNSIIPGPGNYNYSTDYSSKYILTSYSKGYINVITHNTNYLNKLINTYQQNNIIFNLKQNNYDKYGQYLTFTIDSSYVEWTETSNLNFKLNDKYGITDILYNCTYYNTRISKGDNFTITNIITDRLTNNINTGANIPYVFINYNIDQITLNSNINYGVLMGISKETEYSYNIDYSNNNILQHNCFGYVTIKSHDSNMGSILKNTIPYLDNQKVEYGNDSYGNYLIYPGTNIELPDNEKIKIRWSYTNNLNIGLYDDEYIDGIFPILKKIDTNSANIGDYFMITYSEDINNNNYKYLNGTNIPYVYISSNVIDSNDKYYDIKYGVLDSISNNNEMILSQQSYVKIPCLLN
jgi:hypothetical protein